MPSDPTPTPPPAPGNKPPRRRPAPPGFGGNLIWVVILALLVSWLLLQQGGGGGTLEWSDFVNLVDSNNLKKVVLIGHDRISGEVRDQENKSLSAELRQKLAKSRGRFVVQRLQVEEGELWKKLWKLSAEGVNV